MLRRFEKRICIPLPDFKTRTELFEKFLNSKNIEMVPKVDYKELAAKTEGYSGSEIKLVCKEALMSTVRKILPNMVAKSKLNGLFLRTPIRTATTGGGWDVNIIIKFGLKCHFNKYVLWVF